VNGRSCQIFLSRVQRCDWNAVPTLTVDTVIGFGSPEDRAAFASDLQSAVAALVARYHHDDGGPHRLTVSSYLRREEPS
jgi:hypothetical protein